MLLNKYDKKNKEKKVVRVQRNYGNYLRKKEENC